MINQSLMIMNLVINGKMKEQDNQRSQKKKKRIYVVRSIVGSTSMGKG